MQALARKGAAQLTGLGRQAARRRLVGFLARRGYGGSHPWQVVVETISGAHMKPVLMHDWGAPVDARRAACAVGVGSHVTSDWVGREATARTPAPSGAPSSGPARGRVPPPGPACHGAVPWEYQPQCLCRCGASIPARQECWWPVGYRVGWVYRTGSSEPAGSCHGCGRARHRSPRASVSTCDADHGSRRRLGGRDEPRAGAGRRPGSGL